MGSLGGKRGGGGGGGSSISSLLLPRQPAAGPTTLNLHSHKILLKESISEKWENILENSSGHSSRILLCLFYRKLPQHVKLFEPDSIASRPFCALYVLIRTSHQTGFAGPI